MIIGPFGSPYVDSTRTAVTHATTSAIQIVYLSPSIGKEDAERLLASLMNHVYSSQRRRGLNLHFEFPVSKFFT